MFFTKGNPEQFCDHVFRTFDVDGNGHVDFKEFLLAVGITNNGTKEEKLKWAFRMYDINNDGSIQQPEMTKIVKVRSIWKHNPLTLESHPFTMVGNLFLA